jgi:hypothetical protein
MMFELKMALNKWINVDHFFKYDINHQQVLFDAIQVI